jgi:hypothetical protein
MSELDNLIAKPDNLKNDLELVITWFSRISISRQTKYAESAANQLAQLHAALAAKDAQLAEARKALEMIAQPYLYDNESGYFGGDAIHYRHIANDYLFAHPEPK